VSQYLSFSVVRERKRNRDMVQEGRVPDGLLSGSNSEPVLARQRILVRVSQPSGGAARVLCGIASHHDAVCIGGRSVVDELD